MPGVLESGQERCELTEMKLSKIANDGRSVMETRGESRLSFSSESKDFSLIPSSTQFSRVDLLGFSLSARARIQLTFRVPRTRGTRLAHSLIHTVKLHRLAWI